MAADDQPISSVLSLGSNGQDSNQSSTAQTIATTQCPTCGLALPPGTQTCPIDGTPVSDTPAPGLSDRYEFLDILGQGGMAVVHRARHLLLGHTVAIKLLNSNSSYNPTTLKRFRQEAAAAKKVEHPNVIRIEDFGVTPAGQPFMVMECLEGETLAERIKSQGLVTVSEAVPLFKQMCLALEHLHRNNVLHRDLKPSNVFLTCSTDPKDETPIVKLVDFGIAKVIDDDGSGSNKLTATGDVFGTPQYMSPEQCQGLAVSARSDVYSLGCLMYETLVGEPPFAGENPLAVMHQHMHEPPPGLSDERNVPAGGRPRADSPRGQNEIEEIIFKCLEKDPAMRYQSVSDLLTDLDKLETGNFRRQSLPIKFLNFIRRRRNELITAAVTLAVIAGAAYFIAPHKNQYVPIDETIQRRQKELAEEAAADAKVRTEWRQWTAETDLPFRGSAITDASMYFIGKLTNGRHLYLTSTQISDAGSKNLANLKNLETIDLSYTKIGDETVKQLIALPHLHNVNLSHTRVTARSFDYLAQMPELTELYLGGPDFNPAALQNLSRLKMLRTLHMQNVLLQDSAIAELSKETSLQGLQLRLCGLKDDSLSAIGNLKNLSWLDLCQNGISAGGLKPLHSLSNLRELYVDSPAVIGAGSSFTPEAERALRALPKLERVSINGLPPEAIKPLHPRVPFCIDNRGY